MERTGHKTTRRQLLSAIGMLGGTAALYNMMTTLGHAAETQFTGPPNLSGARPGIGHRARGRTGGHGRGL